MLIVVAGLPGVGKSTIARLVAADLGAVYLRADTIEQAMRVSSFSDDQIGGTGYLIAQRVALENLRLGRAVVADMVNPWQLTRDNWREVAKAAACKLVEVEVVCTDTAEHRRRVEQRPPDVPGLSLPTWKEVTDREYHHWDNPPLRVDTSTASAEQCAREILDRIGSAAEVDSVLRTTD